MITIHHLINSRSQRIIWLLEELGLQYKIVFHERDPHTRQASASLYKVHSLGKVPVIIDGDVELAESGAIVDYLIETYGTDTLVPEVAEQAKQSISRCYYLYWKNFAEASLMPYLATTQVFARIEQYSPIIIKPIVKLIVNKVNHNYLHKNLEAEAHLIESHLSKNNWFAGNQFTAADILMTFMLDALFNRFLAKSSFPSIGRFIAAAKERPAYVNALKKGKWSGTEFDSYWNHLRRKL